MVVFIHLFWYRFIERSLIVCLGVIPVKVDLLSMKIAHDDKWTFARLSSYVITYIETNYVTLKITFC